MHRFSDQQWGFIRSRHLSFGGSLVATRAFRQASRRSPDQCTERTPHRLLQQRNPCAQRSDLGFATFTNASRLPRSHHCYRTQQRIATVRARTQNERNDLDRCAMRRNRLGRSKPRCGGHDTRHPIDCGESCIERHRFDPRRSNIGGNRKVEERDPPCRRGSIARLPTHQCAQLRNPSFGRTRS